MSATPPASGRRNQGSQTEFCKCLGKIHSGAGVAGANRPIVHSVLHSVSKKYGIKIYSYANAGNHLHLIIKIGNRFTYAPFIRSLTGILALKISGASKLRSLNKKFWDRRPFTRVIESGKAYTLAQDYILLNRLEAAGVFCYQAGRLRDVELRPFG